MRPERLEVHRCAKKYQNHSISLMYIGLCWQILYGSLRCSSLLLMCTVFITRYCLSVIDPINRLTLWYVLRFNSCGWGCNFCASSLRLFRGVLCLKSQGNEGEDKMSDSESFSEDSDAPVTPRRKKPPATKQARAAPLSAGGSGVKRLKKAADQSSYAITDTKSPGNAARTPTRKSAGLHMGSPVGTPAGRVSPKNVTSMLCLGSPSSSPAPASRTGIPLPEGVLETGRHKHHGLRWLYKDRADKNRRKPDDSDYNPRTLHVPPSFIKTETPAMQQWWQFKIENMDTILFFKV